MWNVRLVTLFGSGYFQFVAGVFIGRSKPALAFLVRVHSVLVHLAKIILPGVGRSFSARPSFL
jgi:hypothetical protein